MFVSIDLLGVYLHLARASALRRRPQAADRFLILAGSVASWLKLPRIAAYCRWQVLEHNPHHLLGHWESLEEALTDEDFLHFFRQLHRRYPQEKAERMLSTLDIEMARERETYYSDEEYAASLLGTDVVTLDEMFGTN
jgi:transposase